MSHRGEKREAAAYHDSRRYLKRHPRRLSDPLFGLQSYERWIGPVRRIIEKYPELAKRREEDLKAGGLGGMRRGPSAESVYIRYSAGPVAAVEKALRQLKPDQRRRVRAVCFEGAPRKKSDREAIYLFQRYVAAYSGYGRKRYDQKSP